MYTIKQRKTSGVQTGCSAAYFKDQSIQCGSTKGSSFSSPLLQGSHEIATRMHTSVLIASRRQKKQNIFAKLNLHVFFNPSITLFSEH